MDRIWKNMTMFLLLVLAGCFVECHAQVCGAAEYTNSAGYVKSPGFPIYNYSNGLDCRYYLRSSGQTFLTIFLHTIDLEYTAGCAYDYVEISCLQNYGTSTFCRLEETRSVSYSSCSQATIRFRTDGSNVNRGFQIYYIFQRFYSASTTRMPTTTTKRTTVLSTTEASTVSITSTEVSLPTDILSSIAKALGPNTSALLVLGLGCLLGLGLLSVITMFIILKCRSRQSKAAIGMIRSEQEPPSQSTVHYSLDPTAEREERKEGVENCRESYMSEHDYVLPDEDDYENADDPTAERGERKEETGIVRESYMSDNDYTLPDEDDYENADGIATINIGRR